MWIHWVKSGDDSHPRQEVAEGMKFNHVTQNSELKFIKYFWNFMLNTFRPQLTISNQKFIESETTKEDYCAAAS